MQGFPPHCSFSCAQCTVRTLRTADAMALVSCHSAWELPYENFHSHYRLTTTNCSHRECNKNVINVPFWQPKKQWNKTWPSKESCVTNVLTRNDFCIRDSWHVLDINTALPFVSGQRLPENFVMRTRGITFMCHKQLQSDYVSFSFCELKHCPKFWALWINQAGGDSPKLLHCLLGAFWQPRAGKFTWPRTGCEQHVVAGSLRSSVSTS